jgi:hypothetical protein
MLKGRCIREDYRPTTPEHKLGDAAKSMDVYI